MRAGVPDAELVGGVSLVSARTGTSPARHWFAGLSSQGPKVARHARAAGPVLGTLHSLSGGVLKLTAQLLPIGPSDPQTVVLQVAPPGTTDWRDVQTVPVGPGYAAAFRVEGWDATRDRAFRVGWARGTGQEAWYRGRVRAEPTGRPLSIGLVNCTIHAVRALEVPTHGTARLPGERFAGLYTRTNLYFPYAELVAGVAAADPDVLVALGDQYYENQPTRRDDQQPLLDVLGKYALWLWSFGSLTRDRPTIVLVDDHDVFQGDLWGWQGRAAPDGDAGRGGYVQRPEWVNTVQRLQCGHDPDPYDPTPVLQGISVQYGAFSYGGVSFALLESRKWKDTNASGTDGGVPLAPPRALLGARQEQFLQEWARMHPGQPKVCLTQTLLACLQTGPDGALLRDPDSGGAPAPARRRALELLQAAGALVLSGDQHLGSLVRHGLDTSTDGPVQFTVPAAGSAYQRWFQPPGPLPHAHGPWTGTSRTPTATACGCWPSRTRGSPRRRCARSGRTRTWGTRRSSARAGASSRSTRSAAARPSTAGPGSTAPPTRARASTTAGRSWWTCDGPGYSAVSTSSGASVRSRRCTTATRRADRSTISAASSSRRRWSCRTSARAAARSALGVAGRLGEQVGGLRGGRGQPAGDLELGVAADPGQLGLEQLAAGVDRRLQGAQLAGGVLAGLGQRALLLLARGDEVGDGLAAAPPDLAVGVRAQRRGLLLGQPEHLDDPLAHGREGRHPLLLRGALLGQRHPLGVDLVAVPPQLGELLLEQGDVRVDLPARVAPRDDVEHDGVGRHLDGEPDQP